MAIGVLFDGVDVKVIPRGCVVLTAASLALCKRQESL